MTTTKRIVLRLSLGVICGLILVLLPAVFSTSISDQYSPTTTNTLGARQPITSNSQTPVANSGASGLSLLSGVLLIFLPSTIFSLVVRRWAQGRARDYL